MVKPDDGEFDTLVERFPPHPAVRAVIVVDVDRVSDSCGFVVPQLEYVGERTLLDDLNARKPPEEIVDYRRRNAVSIDGLPAVDW